MLVLSILKTLPKFEAAYIYSTGLLVTYLLTYVAPNSLPRRGFRGGTQEGEEQ